MPPACRGREGRKEEEEEEKVEEEEEEKGESSKKQRKRLTLAQKTSFHKNSTRLSLIPKLFCHVEDSLGMSLQPTNTEGECEEDGLVPPPQWKS